MSTHTCSVNGVTKSRISTNTFTLVKKRFTNIIEISNREMEKMSLLRLETILGIRIDLELGKEHWTLIGSGVKIKCD